MTKPANPLKNAQNVHADLPDQALAAQLARYDVVDSFGSVDALAVFGSQLYFGSGNSPLNFHIDQNNTLGFQLDLKEHYRTGNDIPPLSIDADGTAHYLVPAGTQVADPAHGVSSANANRSAWNFDYVVATGLNGSGGTLSDLTFKIAITQNGNNTHVFTLDPTTHAWIDESNPSIGFGGDDFSHPATAQTQSQVAENSVNLGFLTGAFGPLSSSTAVGTTYDIQVEAFRGPHMVGHVHDVVTLANLA